jgi:diguanylate cyclase (GGDEF)-like protein/PAS domain S-box-containing protein
MTKTKILVVEDERIVALHLRLQLTRLGYDVVAVVFRGDQVLRLMHEHHPDVILMDIHIEGDIDGIETASEIRAVFRTPVIFLTAHTEEATLERARATQPFGYLLKPFSERELHATIQMVIERRAVEVALSESEQRLRLALDAAEMGSWELDPATRQLSPVGHAGRIFGFSGEVFSGDWDDFLGQVFVEDRPLVGQMFDCVLDGDRFCQVEFRSLRIDGSFRWLKVQGRAFDLGNNNVKRIIGVVQDVTDRRIGEERLRQAATVFEATQDGIVIFDADLHILNVNKSFSDMTGYGEEDLVGQELYLLTEKADGLETRRDVLMSTLRKTGRWQGEMLGIRKDGNKFPLQVKAAAVKDDAGTFTHYIAVCSDISAVRQAESKLKYLAHFDPLTGLPNRLLAMDRLEHAMARCVREHDRVGLLFVDLDHFKNINDTLGHSVGDELLRGVAKRMCKAVRTEDTVARLGGDEFMVIIEQVDRIEDIADVARKIGTLVSLPISVAAGELGISASIGISLFPEDGATREALIRAADTAMYAAKDMGRNRYAFYTNEMTVNAVQYMRLKQDLRRGIDQKELSLFFQPQISLSDGRVTGVEALVRWRHNERGLLGADHVIPVAEKSGLILDVGEWVLIEACRQAKLWESRGFGALRVAVNVSPQQMRTGRLMAAIDETIRQTGIAPGQLEIEITESMLQDEAGCVSSLHAMKERGLTLAIDDFGTGYSCLSSLKNLPIHRLKIDRAFVQDIPDDRNNAAITRAIVAMAHTLELDVIAEGVETVTQENFLRALGCDEVQGFLYAKPMSAEAIETLLTRTPSTGRAWSA